jgi:hypothetical protein
MTHYTELEDPEEKVDKTLSSQDPLECHKIMNM